MIGGNTTRNTGSHVLSLETRVEVGFQNGGKAQRVEQVDGHEV